MLWNQRSLDIKWLNIFYSVLLFSYYETFDDIWRLDYHLIGRDLQRITGSNTSQVGNFSMKEIKNLGAFYQHTNKLLDFNIPTIEEALVLISKSVKQVILDAKIGPPSYENGLAKDIISVVEKTQCKNCLVWAKSDSLVRDIIKLSSDMKVGYIVMMDPSTGERTNLLRMKGAKVVGAYHPLIDEDLMRMMHRRDKKVYAWTVDDVDSMKRMLVEGVDAVVTSNPTLLGSVMQDIRTTCLENGFSLPSR